MNKFDLPTDFDHFNTFLASVPIPPENSIKPKIFRGVSNGNTGQEWVHALKSVQTNKEVVAQNTNQSGNHT